MANVPYGIETLPKISIAWVGCTNVTGRQTTDGRTMTNPAKNEGLGINVGCSSCHETRPLIIYVSCTYLTIASWRTKADFYRASWNADAVLRWEFWLSVCLSVCQTRALWQNGRKICPDFYTMRKIIWSSFVRRRMVGEGHPFYLKFWVNRPPLEQNRRFWTDNRS